MRAHGGDGTMQYVRRCGVLAYFTLRDISVVTSGICSPSATENVAEGRVILEKGSVQDLELSLIHI